LNELKVSRPDWSRVPLALARLDREELAESAAAGAGTDEARRQERIESAITAYRRAIELGMRDPLVVREFVQLLFDVGRGSEALEIYSRIPTAGQLPGGLERMVSEFALRQRDFSQAEDSARKVVAANPGDYPARVWLAHVLIVDRRPDEAETVLRDAVAANQADPDRWANLVTFLVQNRRFEKVEKAIGDAQAHIAQAPLVMAQCCETVGRAYGVVEPDKAKSWYGQARHWFDEAQKALKDPNDLTVKRRLAEFLIRTNQADEAEGPLREILARTEGGRSPDAAAWARRVLAQVYALGDPPRIEDALALLADKVSQPGGNAEDLRVLSRVHEAQGTPEGRRRAIADLKMLVGRDSAVLDDRLRLAQLLDTVGDWDQAREQFRELIDRTEALRDTDTLARRPQFITLFFDALIRRHKPGDDADLAEASQLIEKLRPMTQRNPITPLVMEARRDKAANRPDEAAKRIRQFADRTDLTTAGRLLLAGTAEQLGLFDVALAIFRRIADEPDADPNTVPNWARLPLYLGRRGQVKDAVDLCAVRWADPKQRQQVASVCTGILASPDTPLDKEQMQRVIGWFSQERQQEPRAVIYALGLGNLYERLDDYRKAEEQYRDAIKIDDHDGVASNNLAWLIALKDDGRGTEALDLINRAIKARANPEYFDTRGMLLLAAGQEQRAITDLVTALKAAPSPPKYFHLAQAYLKLKDKEKARRIFEAGKNRGLPSGLHNLELPQYKKLTSDLGTT
jgi:tetratricopeptide (TPR) repeat protein